MTYNSIPVPQFSFTDIPESEAEKIANTYFKYTYNVGYRIDAARDDIRQKVAMQDSKDDRIVILSYLINKLTERIVTLPEPRSDMEKGIRQRETIPTYTALLHFLYRLIEQENIEIPKDLFDKESYQMAQRLLLTIDESLEQIKNDNPHKAEAITAVQNEVKKSKKYLYLGKEDWAKIVIGAVVGSIIKEDLMSHLPALFLLVQTLLTKWIGK